MANYLDIEKKAVGIGTTVGAEDNKCVIDWPIYLHANSYVYGPFGFSTSTYEYDAADLERAGVVAKTPVVFNKCGNVVTLSGQIETFFVADTKIFKIPGGAIPPKNIRYVANYASVDGVICQLEINTDGYIYCRSINKSSLNYNYYVPGNSVAEKQSTSRVTVDLFINYIVDGTDELAAPDMALPYMLFCNNGKINDVNWTGYSSEGWPAILYLSGVKTADEIEIPATASKIRIACNNRGGSTARTLNAGLSANGSSLVMTCTKDSNPASKEVRYHEIEIFTGDVTAYRGDKYYIVVKHESSSGPFTMKVWFE